MRLFAQLLPDPAPGELLSSLLARAAHRRGQTATRFASGHWPEAPIWGRDIDRQAGDALIARLALDGGLPEPQLTITTLRPEAVALGGHSAAAPGGGAAAIAPFIMSLGVRGVRRRNHGLAFCPVCLADEPGLYFKRWRYAFSLACPTHGVWLHDACPRCDAPLEFHRNLVLRTARCAMCAESLASAAPVEAPAAQLAFEAAHEDELGRAVAAAPIPARSPGRAVATPLIDRTDVLCRVASHPWTAPRVADALGVGISAEWASWPRLEEMRIRQRRDLFAVAAAWSADWPDRFEEAALIAGLSQRSFSRIGQSAELAALIARLPARKRGHTDRGPRVHDAKMRRLRRRKPRDYGPMRAARVLAELQREV